MPLDTIYISCLATFEGTLLVSSVILSSVILSSLGH